jgi:hypothetical protein
MQEEAFKRRFAETYKSRYSGAQPTNFTALDFVGALGCVGEALLYSKLFLPDLVEIDGMILLSDFVEDAGGTQAVRELFERFGNASEVERTLNHFQVNLNFPNRLAENHDGDEYALAKELANAWTLWLRKNYPGRTFVVRVLNEKGEASVCFHQTSEEMGSAATAVPTLVE